MPPTKPKPPPPRRAKTPPPTNNKSVKSPPNKAKSVSHSKTTRKISPRTRTAEVSTKPPSATTSPAIGKAAIQGRPGKSAVKKNLKLDIDKKNLLLRTTTKENLAHDFDRTGIYTRGPKGYEFTNKPLIDLDKLTDYINNDVALNDGQLWNDYDEMTKKLKIPPKRNRKLAVSNFRNLTKRENNNIYAYVLGRIQEKFAERYFDKKLLHSS